jgi:ferritin
MINQKVNEALNGQLNAELYSSYLYLSMSAYFQSINLYGFASWMRVQAGEELVHAMKFYDYVAQNGKVALAPVAAPQTSWSSPLAAFENVYNHELKVTGLIHALANLATAENDQANRSFLQWYIDEQVEEEESSGGVLQKVRSAGSDKAAMAALDRELSQRAFKFPSGYQIFPANKGTGATIGSLKK